MRKTVIHCCMLLAGGAILTVLSAWLLVVHGYALGMDPQQFAFDNKMVLLWDSAAPAEFELRPRRATSVAGHAAYHRALVTSHIDRIGVHWFWLTVYENQQKEEIYSGFSITEQVQFMHAGWPFKSFVSRHWWKDRAEYDYPRNWSQETVAINTGVGSFRLAAWEGWDIMVPYRPRYGFLTGNILFYSLLLWVTFRVPGYAIRFTRRRRGVCSACGYDLQGEPKSGCPECGWNRPAGEGEAPVAPESNGGRA